MSESTKDYRHLIYTFLSDQGINIPLVHRILKQMLKNYARAENAELLKEVKNLRSKIGKYRSIIHQFNSNKK